MASLFLFTHLKCFMQGVFEVQKDACCAGQKVVIVDDLLATGGEILCCEIV